MNTATAPQNPTLDLVFGWSGAHQVVDHEAAQLAGTPQSFWPIALPYARQAAPACNVSIALVLAQWAIETGYGGYDWTTEHNPGNVGSFDGAPLNFFPNLAEGVQAYEQCMMQGYYANVRQGPNAWYAESLALGQSPWASGKYALPGSYPGSELIYVVNQYNLSKYDSGGPTPAPSPTPQPILVMKPTSGRYGVLNAPVVAVLETPSGNGYTLVGADGGTFNYGDAPFLGSLGSIHLNAPIVDAAFSPSGKGLYMVATDGGVFCWGDANFKGSAGSLKLAAPVVSISVTDSNDGYTLVAADGGVFNYGTNFYGSPA